MVTNIHWSNIENDTINNEYYRKVIFTSRNQQLVLMSIKPKDDIPKEIHNDNDQFIRIEKGTGKLYVGPNEKDSYDLTDGVAVIIPAGTWHHIVNISETEPLKLYTIYSPPHHPRDTLQVVKQNEHAINNKNNMKGGSKKGRWINRLY